MYFLIVYFIFWNSIIVAPLENNFKLHQNNVSKERNRIIGGQLCRAGQFPFVVAISSKTPDSLVFCGGALLSPQWILTAAHCVDKAIVMEIILGAITLSDENPNKQVISSSSYYLHPDYNKVTLDNDIALVNLRQPVEFNDYIGKVHLPVTSYSSDVNVTALGWGQTSDNESGFDDNLNCVQMITISNIECQIYYGPQITDNMICVSGQYQEGICTGDSGGPLIYLLNFRHPIAIGVASFHSAYGCEGTEPSGYTRTFPNKEWILNITGPLS